MKGSKVFKRTLESVATFILLAALVVGAYRASQDDLINRSKTKSAQAKAAYEKYGVLDFIDCIIAGEGDCIKRKTPGKPIKDTSKESGNNTSEITEKDTSGETEQESLENAPKGSTGGIPLSTLRGVSKGMLLDEVNKKTFDKAVADLAKIKISEPAKVEYSRTDWKHWESFGRTCWNVREEALARQAVPSTIKVLNKDKNLTKSIDEACYVAAGKWIDLYSGNTVANPSSLDLDHIVPLSYAARHGGQSWNSETKKKFANDLDNNLLIVSARENRAKSDKGPSQYMPADENFHCQYAIRWIDVTNKYKLTITEKDHKRLSETLSKKCVVK